MPSPLPQPAVVMRSMAEDPILSIANSETWRRSEEQ